MRNVPVRKNNQSGFSLIEVLVGAAVFMFIAVSVFKIFASTMDAVRLAGLKITVAALANEQLEIVRNLTYADVGISGGIPSGKVPAAQTLTRDNKTFLITTVIRNIDDPFDGTIGGTPNDLSPADYKLVELEISCPSNPKLKPMSFTTYSAPRSLETSSTNGALFIQVIDASGQPVQGADVAIVNASSSPPISINDTTNNDGRLQIIDAPPGFEAYAITVTKTGYSTDRTYPTGAPANPNPVKPNSTVAVQQVTQISFSIDELGTLDVSSSANTCSAAASIDFEQTGMKLIGSSPDVLKYDAALATDAAGHLHISGVEWDTYDLQLTDPGFDLAGTIPALPISFNPGATQDLRIIVSPKSANSLLVIIKDSTTQLPLADASVKISKTGFEETLVTDRGFLTQTDWSGGAGQDNYTDITKYFDSDGNLEISDPTGELKLKKIFSDYEPAGYLISSSLDIGSAGNFHQLLWQPVSQPPATGPDSVKFQAAANNDNATWNFIGPDGTAATYFTVADQDLSGLFDGSRYFRYKAYLNTASTTWTPDISDISVTFTSACVPPGQVMFTGLDSTPYSIEVTKAGYQTAVDTADITAAWQNKEIILSP